MRMTSDDNKKDERSAKKRILTAAKHLFATQGLDETNRLEIAHAADVAPAFLARQFGSKDQLLAEVLDAGWSPIRRRIRAVWRVQEPQKRLARALELLLDSWHQDREVADLMLIEARRMHTRVPIGGGNYGFANCVAVFDQYVAQCRALGSWPDHISNAAIRSALLALVEGLFLHERLYKRIGFPAPATADEARKLILLFISGLNQQPYNNRQ
jgi:AcrR family transcriptional regulator